MRFTTTTSLALGFVGCLLAVFVSAQGADQAWGYVQVRPRANMFYWLYRAETNPQTRPLILWLQGGPGGSGVGFGNFEELGPLDVSQKQREHRWTKLASVLFVDNPVGTGYSYVTDTAALTTNIDEISADLLAFMQNFVTKFPEFKTIPFYIFCESYGGKMSAHFGQVLFDAIKDKKIEMNLKGVAIGDGWVSPIDSVLSWGPFLRAVANVDDKDAKQIDAAAKNCASAVARGDWEDATNLWGLAENTVSWTTDSVNFYNILIHNGGFRARHNETSLQGLSRHHLGARTNDALDDLMNGPLKEKLGIPSTVRWGGQANAVFAAQSGDFMKPVIDSVDKLLNNSVPVYIYSGQLDLICSTPGNEVWVDKLKWSGMPAFRKANRKALYTKESGMNTQGFLKTYANLSFFYILNAGHMVPADNGAMAMRMVSMITGSKE